MTRALTLIAEFIAYATIGALLVFAFIGAIVS